MSDLLFRIAGAVINPKQNPGGILGAILNPGYGQNNPYASYPYATPYNPDPYSNPNYPPVYDPAALGNNLNLSGNDLKNIGLTLAGAWALKQTMPGIFKLPGSSKKKTEVVDPDAETDSAKVKFKNSADMQDAVQQLLDINGNGKLFTFGRDGTTVMIWNVKDYKLVNGNTEHTAESFVEAMAANTAYHPTTLMLRSSDKFMRDRFSTFVQGGNTEITEQHDIVDPEQSGLKTTGTITPAQSPVVGYMTNFVPADSIGFKDPANLQRYIDGKVAVLKDVNFVTKDEAGNPMIWEPVKGQGLRTVHNGTEILLSAQNFSLMWSQLKVPDHEDIVIKNELAAFSKDQKALEYVVGGINTNINSRNQAEGLNNPTLKVSEYRAAPVKTPVESPGNDVKTGTADAGKTSAGKIENPALVDDITNRLYEISKKWGQTQTWADLKKDPLLQPLQGAIAGLLFKHVETYTGTGKLGRYLDAKGVGSNDEKYVDNPNPINPFNNGELKALIKSELTKEGMDLNRISAQLEGICKVTSYGGTSDLHKNTNRGEKLSLLTAEKMVQDAYRGKQLPAAPVADPAQAWVSGGAKPAAGPELAPAGGG